MSPSFAVIILVADGPGLRRADQGGSNVGTGSEMTAAEYRTAFGAVARHTTTGVPLHGGDVRKSAEPARGHLTAREALEER
ncbi:MAG TPA: hypothetical protein VMK13_01215 [Streptosporangiaceae bacterium]|nr:hypothetical protein [Streptosporangiaceae bacterium]